MKLWDLSGYSEKSNIQEAYLPKTSISGQIVSEISAQLCSDDSIHTNPSKFDLGILCDLVPKTSSLIHS